MAKKSETYRVAFNVRHVKGVGKILGDGCLTTASRTGNQPNVVVLLVLAIGGISAVGGGRSH